VFAYTDESGNTGLQLFDEQQPVFLTLTLLSAHDLDPILAPRHAEWLQRLGITQLHGNELGIGMLERIAPSARQFLDLVEAQFILTFIHKPYFGAVKFVDAVLDNGVNEAVNFIHYWMRPLRLPLAAALVASMEDEDVRSFWDAWATRDLASFVEVVKRVRANLQWCPDRRIVELLGDALAWAQAHPAALLDTRRSKLDAPNVLALTLIVDALHEVVGFGGGQVLRFVHDREQQFAKALKDAFEIVHQVAPKRQPATALLDFEIVKTFGCPIELAESATSPTLQFVDSLLWLLRRRRDLVTGTAPKCADLLSSIVERTVVSEFSAAQLRRDILRARAEVNDLPITAEQAVRGQEFLKQLERDRKTRMGGGDPE
jgi:hypothetical protein